MADLLSLGQYVQQGFEQGRERKNKATLAKLYSQALAAPEDQQAGMVQQMAAVNPDFANSAQANFSNGRKQAYDDLGREAGMFVALAQSGDPATAQAAYTRLAQKAQAAGHPVPPTYDPKMLPMIEKLAGVTNTAAGVQSTYIDNQGQRVAVLRDGTVRVLGANAPNNQIIDTGNGFVGVNKGNLSAAPVMLGGQPQGMQQTQYATSDGQPIPQGEQAAAQAAFAAAGRGQDFDITVPVGGGAVQDVPQGQQLRSAPKPQAPSALDERIELARRMGATPEQIKQMVVGSAGQDAAPDVPGDTSKTGDAYLSTLPQQTASQVRALADGRMQFPSGTALKSPYWQGMLSAVSQYDPNFDAVNYNARSNTRKAFTSGKEAQTVNALNTVAEHLGKFSDNAAALHNFGHLGVFTHAVNSVKNAYLDRSGDPRIAAFNTNKKAVADEVAKVWRATGGSEADIQENLKNLDGAQSPEQLNAAIGTLTQLIYGKVAALQDQYASGMGTTQKPRSLVSKEAQAAFDKTLQRMNGNAAPAQSGPKVIRYDAQGNRIP